MGDLIVIGVLLLLVFGGKKLRTVGTDLGTAVRGFKNALKAANAPAAPAKPVASSEPDAEFPEVMAAKSPPSGKDRAA